MARKDVEETPRHWIAVAAITALVVGCGTSPTSDPTTPRASAGPVTSVGNFPTIPTAALPDELTSSLRAAVDDPVEVGTFEGVTAAVVVAGQGTWSGAAGVDEQGAPLSAGSQLLTASVAKTVTAAEVLHLVEGGNLGLDDPAVDHLPRAIARFDLHGATIRDLLGMRSGVVDRSDYVAAVNSGAGIVELLEGSTFGSFAPGSQVDYENVNYVLLGTIVEEESGRSFWSTLRSGVLDGEEEGFVFPRTGALAADGWQVRVDAGSLARWGYELYGGAVLSDASLQEMTDFHDDWYGLGAIDFGHGTPALEAFGVPAIGHGGMEGNDAAMVVAFPDAGVVVAVQARGTSLEAVAGIARALEVAATA